MSTPWKRASTAAAIRCSWLSQASTRRTASWPHIRWTAFFSATPTPAAPNRSPAKPSASRRQARSGRNSSSLASPEQKTWRRKPCWRFRSKMPAVSASRNKFRHARSEDQLMTNGKLQRWKSVFLSVVLLIGVAPLQAREPAPSFDLVITNGRIIDGTGSPWYSGDIGIRDGKISSIGNLRDAPRARTIDAGGMVVAPGFIDMLGQSEYTILVDPRLPSKIYQGITTEITGEGESIAPLNDAILRADQEQYDHYHIRADWRTFREYFSRLAKQRIGVNIASYVGATRGRRMVLGDNDVQPTPAQLQHTKEFLRQAMHDGAVSVSTSIEYTPAPYAKTDELIALAGEASKFGGIYTTHMRN